jgi:hypothetical protein
MPEGGWCITRIIGPADPADKGIATAHFIISTPGPVRLGWKAMPGT